MSSPFNSAMTLNGTLGAATMTNGLGEKVQLFISGDVKLSANVITAKTKHVGSIVSQPKPMGVELSGMGNIFSGSPQYAAMISTFLATGIFPMFSIQLDIDDLGANLNAAIMAALPVGSGGMGGTQTVMMTGCVLDGEHVIAQVSTSTEPLKMDLKWVGSDLLVSTPFGNQSLAAAMLSAAASSLTSNMLGGLFSAGASAVST